MGLIMKNIVFTAILLLALVISATNCNGMQNEERDLENRDERPQENPINTVYIPIYIEYPDGTIQTEYITMPARLYNELRNAGLYRGHSEENT